MFYLLWLPLRRKAAIFSQQFRQRRHLVAELLHHCFCYCAQSWDNHHSVHQVKIDNSLITGCVRTFSLCIDNNFNKIIYKGRKQLIIYDCWHIIIIILLKINQHALLLQKLLDRDNLSSHMPQPAQPGPLGSCSHLPRLQQTDLHQFGTGLGTLWLPSHCLVRQPNSYKAQRSIVQMINNDKDNSITKHSIRQYSRTASNTALDSRDHNTFR